MLHETILAALARLDGGGGPDVAMAGHHDPLLAVLSVLIAILASYAALELAGRVAISVGRGRLAWLTGGAVAMGVGIWSMHFTAMLAYSLPVPIYYEVPMSLLSILIAIGLSLFALFMVSRERVPRSTLLIAGTGMGGAIGGMHYTGMAAVWVEGSLRYDPLLVAASIAIGIGAAILSLWLLIHFRHREDRRAHLGKMASAVVMGFAIVGLHYTGMAAVRFFPETPAPDMPDVPVLTPEGLAPAVVSGAFVVLVLALAAVHMHRRVRRMQMETEAIRRQSAALAASIDGIAVLDEKRTLVHVNDAYAEVHGYADATELIGENWKRLYDEDALHRFEHEIVPAFAREGRWRGRAVGRRRDGSRFPQELSLSAMDGGGLVCVVRDVSEQQEAEEALRRSEARYRQFFEEDLTGDVVTTVDGEIVACNPAFAEFLGFDSPEHLQGRSFTPFYVDDEERRELIERVRSSGKVEGHECDFRRRDGRIISAVLNMRGDFDETGALTRLRGYLFDITARKELEKHVRQSQKMEAVGRLAGGIAHDFNNILTVIQGNVELLLMDLPTGDPRRQELQEVRDSAEHAAALTRQLLTFSRKQVVQPERLNVAAAVRDSSRMLRRLIGEDLELVTRIDGTCGSVFIDRAQLEQLLVNLVLNARDVTPPGGRITIEVRDEKPEEGRRVGSENPHLLVSVTDSGPGVPDKVLPHIFEPFFTTKEKGKGTGLGLSIVHEVVRQSGGQVVVESDADQGSTFKVYLPCAEEGVPTVREEPGSTARGSGKVLVVEDEDAVRRLARRVLERAGYAVVEAENGREGLRVAREHGGTIDLLVTDVVMPDMGERELEEGFATLYPDTPVIYMSGYTEGKIDTDRMLERDRAFLKKPFSPEDLLEVVGRALRPA